MSLVKEMPVLAVSRQLEISDIRLWRIVHHYVDRLLGELDLFNVAMVGVDETTSRRGHGYITVFLDMQRKQAPVIFADPGLRQGHHQGVQCLPGSSWWRCGQCGRGCL
ncbi:hypothetical protein [Vreelandella aquamarina]|uniref:hypothetical protein n=1 Tax=Vreelandella aquamarina TaxID=77097 RepID=UPI00384CF79C